MLEPADFDMVRTDICTSGPPSDGDNLLGMEIDASVYLDPGSIDGAPELWHGMRVERWERTEWLIRGRAVGRREDVSFIVAELSRIWEQRLRYHYRSEHTVATTNQSVLFRAVTQIGPGDFWVTAEVEITLS